MKRIRRSYEEKKAIVDRVQELVKQGMTIDAAINQSGYSKSVYYKYMSLFKKNNQQPVQETKEKRVYTRKKPTLMPLPEVKTKEKVFMFYGDAEQIQSVMRGLQ